MNLVCDDPFTVGKSAFGCGRCLACSRRRRQIWAHRLELESLEHDENAFITLSYSQEKLPHTREGLPTLYPQHITLWLKRLRKTIAPFKARYMVVGEYGSKSERPHYHALVFGFPTCQRHQTNLTLKECCAVCTAVQETWDFGSVHLARVEPRSIQYVCGYVLKKMTSREDLRLGGRHPEYARMSLKPGIGAGAMHDVASVILQYNQHKKLEDVPAHLDQGKKKKPLGRYLRQTLRRTIGRSADAPLSLNQEKEMLLLWERAIANKRGLKAQVKEESQGRIRQLEWMNSNLGKKRGSL